MTPVISPIWFWLFGVSDELKFWCILISAVAIVGVIACIISIFVMSLNDYYDDEVVKMKALLKKTTLVLVPIALLSIVIPDQSTLTKMLIAQNVTYERVEAATDTVETVYNDIMTLFEDNNSEGETK